VLELGVDLETQRTQVEQQRAEAVQRFSPQHPMVKALDAQLEELAQEKLALQKRTAALPETQQEILSFQQDLDINTQLYMTLLNSVQQLEVSKAGTIGNVRIIDYAIPPINPARPKPVVVLALGSLLGLLLGAGVVLLQKALLKGVDNPEDIERVIGIPTYAAIPFTSAQRGLARTIARSKSSGASILAEIEGRDPAIEALRSLRTSLHFALMDAVNNVVMFTGPSAGLGKSFISVNLGAVLAQSGKKVVIVDADMRRGHLHRYFGVSAGVGLSDHVVGDVDETKVVQRTHIAGLDMVTTGARPPNPAELLMHERFAALIKFLSSRYDYVLIDTPPVLPVTDAAIVGRLVGTTLLVLKSAEHPMRHIEETVRRLRQAGVQVKGALLNQMGARLGSYGYGSYGYAYAYKYEDAE